MKFSTSYKKNEIINTLKEQVETIPTTFQSFNVFWLYGKRQTSPVCGKINENNFELRNSRNPSTSLRAIGKIYDSTDQTVIEINFQKPAFQDLISVYIFKSYKYDKVVILRFLNDWLPLKEL